MSGESVKNGTRGSGSASQKNKKSTTTTTTTTTKSKPQITICVLIGTRPKEHHSKPLEGRNFEAGDAHSGTPGNGQGRKAARLKSALRSTKHISKTERSKLRGQSRRRWRKAMSPFRMSNTRQNKSLLILTNMQKWFYFCGQDNLAICNLTIGKVAPKALQ